MFVRSWILPHPWLPIKLLKCSTRKFIKSSWQGFYAVSCSFNSPHSEELTSLSSARCWRWLVKIIVEMNQQVFQKLQIHVDLYPKSSKKSTKDAAVLLLKRRERREYPTLQTEVTALLHPGLWAKTFSLLAKSLLRGFRAMVLKVVAVLL